LRHDLSAAADQTITLTANVASTTSNTPTGTVTILDKGTALQTVTLTNGTASYSTTLAGEYLRRDDHTVFLLPCAPNEAVKTGSGSDLRAICTRSNISDRIQSQDFSTGLQRHTVWLTPVRGVSHQGQEKTLHLKAGYIDADFPSSNNFSLAFTRRTIHSASSWRPWRTALFDTVSAACARAMGCASFICLSLASRML
jgi:Bacterial Ig-like domain (group 3)